MCAGGHICQYILHPLINSQCKWIAAPVPSVLVDFSHYRTTPSFSFHPFHHNHLPHISPYMSSSFQPHHPFLPLNFKSHLISLSFSAHLYKVLPKPFQFSLSSETNFTYITRVITILGLCTGPFVCVYHPYMASKYKLIQCLH